MWKIVTRGIRETLERRVCRTNVYSQSTQDNAKNDAKKTSLACQQKFLAPILNTCDKGFCGSTRSAGTKDKEHDNKWNAKHTWPEAFGWSSILAAGLLVCQSLCLHKRIVDKENKERKNKLFDCAGLSRVLTHILTLQARNIFPVTNCIGNDDKKHNLKSQDSDSDSQSQSNAEKQFGPMTSEEAFKEAIDEFADTHKLIVGECELRHGIKALDEKRYKDAWTHFSEGAKLSSPGSMFNLGLCYELGIGTSADLKKAVKYYNDAAAHDHADALYNLGVFHAQGRGDLSVDINIARVYFTKAAELGQAQAQHALDLEKTEIRLKKNDETPINCLKKANPEIYKTRDIMRGKLINYSDKLNANFIDKSTYNMSEYNEKIIEESTKVIFDILGLKESNQIPILITTNEYNVPY